MELTHEQLQQLVAQERQRLEKLDNILFTVKSNTVHIPGYGISEISANENELLESLAKKSNQTKGEVLRKALALINIAILSQEQGATLAIVKDGQILTEIVGF